MPLYIGDYVADTMHLNAQEHGAYLLLLMHYWRNGPLPTDDRTLSAMARVEIKEWIKRTGPVVLGFFTIFEGRHHQKRMDEELAKAEQISGKRRDAGIAGASARHGKPDGKDMANDKQMPPHARRAPAGYSHSHLHKESQSSDAAEPPRLDLGEAPARRGSRLPKDWKPCPEGDQHCRDYGLIPALVLAAFTDFWKAQPGAKGVKLDWEATWRNWCRNDRNARPPRTNGAGPDLPITGTF